MPVLSFAEGGKHAVHGFKADVGADADTALVEQVSVTSANIKDGRAGPEALPDNPGEVFAGVEDGRRPPRLSWQPLPGCRAGKGRNTADRRDRHVGPRRSRNAAQAP